MFKIIQLIILIILALIFVTFLDTRTVFSVTLALMAFTSSLFRSMPYLINVEALRASIKAITKVEQFRQIDASSVIFRLSLFIGFPAILLTLLLLKEFGLISSDGGDNWAINLALTPVVLAFESGGIFYLLCWIHYTEDDTSEFGDLKDKIKGRYIMVSLVILTTVLLLGIYGYIRHGV